MTAHQSQRLRHPVVFRAITVERVHDITPMMRRVVFGGADLEGFLSAAPDDHAKLFFPAPGTELRKPTMTPDGLVFPEGVGPLPMRDYTPRHFDPQRRELTIDFVLHGDGPAAGWAANATVGQAIGVGGPRGSMVVADDFDTYVLAGDETALPAIGRWLEEMPASARAVVVIEVANEAERQVLVSKASVAFHWCFRNAGSDTLETTLRDLAVPAGDTFWWVATESRRARNLRALLVDQRGNDSAWVKATGYWKLAGQDDASD
jgi:NADPH-dependent ferric siderophore reductase